MGTLRFDLNALAENKDKASRKTAQALKKKFLEKARRLPSCSEEGLAPPQQGSRVRACFACTHREKRSNVLAAAGVQSLLHAP